MSQERELTIRKLYMSLADKTLKDGTSVHLEGWVRSNRDNGTVGFIEFNDGSYFKNLQLVYSKDVEDYESVSHTKYGSAISVEGKIAITPANRQPFEIQV